MHSFSQHGAQLMFKFEPFQRTVSLLIFFGAPRVPMCAHRTALFASCSAQIWRASASRSILASTSVNLRMQSNHAARRANQTTRDKAARFPRHLTLVFDINKTIVMADAAGNKQSLIDPFEVLKGVQKFFCAVCAHVCG
jgi:hypothetical protein